MALNSACKGCGTRLGPEDNDGPITQPECCARCRAKAPANAIAELGRRQKALARAVVIDANFIRQFPKLDPFDQAGRIRLASFTWTDTQWEDIGESCALGDAEPQGEGIDYLDSKTLLLTSERARGRPGSIHRLQC